LFGNRDSPSLRLGHLGAAHRKLTSSLSLTPFESLTLNREKEKSAFESTLFFFLFGGWDELRTKFIKNVDKIEEVLERVERLIS
jgi:hypothetical protein